MDRAGTIRLRRIHVGPGANLIERGLTVSRLDEIGK
jgi:hypothetical protein